MLYWINKPYYISSKSMNKLTERAIKKWQSIEEKGEMVCTRCKKVQPLSLFNKRTDRVYKGYYNRCRECSTKEGYASFKEKQQSVKGRLSLCLTYAKSRKKKKEISIDLKFLLDVWKKQKGLCFYTNKPMVSDPEHSSKWDVITIDRKDSTIGYTKDNVVLCRWIVNYMKQDLDLTTFYEVVKQLNTNKKKDI